jgi:hypothetical protein
MVTSLIPGPLGLIASAATGIGSAISAGFDAAAEAEKAKVEAEKQRKANIKIENAQITAINLDTQQSTTDALLGAGVKGTDLQGIINSATTKIAGAAISGVTDEKKAFETLTTAGFADVFAKGTGKQQDALIASIETVMAAQAKSFEEAVQAISPIYGQGGGGGKGVKAVQKYIKDAGLDKVATVEDEETGDVFTGTPEEIKAKKAEWADAARRRSAVDRGKEKLAPLETAMTSLNDPGQYSGNFGNVFKNDNIWNDAIYKALGIAGKDVNARSETFAKKYQGFLGSIDTDKLKADLQPLIDAYSNIIVQNTNTAPLQPAGTRPLVLAPNAPYNPPGKVSSTGLPYIPSAPGTPAAPVGPTGKVGDEINVNDPNTKGLLPVLTKLANATPNVMVVNVKNKSELDALYRKLGLPTT